MPTHVWMSKFPKILLQIKCLAFLVFAVQCHPLDKPDITQNLSESPTLSMRNWQTVVIQQGKQRVKVSADSLYQLDAQGSAHIQGQVRVLFYDGLGDTASVLSATKGVVASDSRHIRVFGHVVVLASDSTRLETDSLRWDREQERIFGDGLVSLFRPDGHEVGFGFDASADLKQWTLKDVKTRVTGKVK